MQRGQFTGRRDPENRAGVAAAAAVSSRAIKVAVAALDQTRERTAPVRKAGQRGKGARRRDLEYRAFAGAAADTGGAVEQELTEEMEVHLTPFSVISVSFCSKSVAAVTVVAHQSLTSIAGRTAICSRHLTSSCAKAHYPPGRRPPFANCSDPRESLSFAASMPSLSRATIP